MPKSKIANKQKVKNNPQLSLEGAGIHLPGMTMSDDKFMTGDDKKKVLKHWGAFLARGCRWQDFTKALYHHLIYNCGFIAHYNLRGFYETYFEQGDDIIHFLSQFDRSKGCPSIEYGRWFCWVLSPGMNDINNALCDVATKYIPALVAAASSQQKEADIAEAKALLGKHGISLK